MTQADKSTFPRLLIMVAGAKGAIGTTIAAALAELHRDQQAIFCGLTTAAKFPRLGDPGRIQMAGWDKADASMAERVRLHGVLPEAVRQSHSARLSQLDIRPAPADNAPMSAQVEQIRADMQAFMAANPGAQPVLLNLLPAAWDAGQCQRLETLEALLKAAGPGMPDLGYTLAALLSGIPVVNFSPNSVELPLICREAATRGVPLAGRDGKTGQTYFKVVLASALKARCLYVDGWYSLNILGNADGRNLMDPDRACGKLHNKTQLLDDILGYEVGERYDAASHIVRIDYYPPRGDAKEAWDVIDFKGIFGLPMSLRLNLQGRDSILAAPMAIDLARWAVAAKKAGISGPIADLGFYFKKPVGPNPPLTFQEQLAALERLEKRIEENWVDEQTARE
ncbi:MAG: inositol-3-phosphate synthase [Desulfobacteraceae bacterium]|nr:MAG: inositol-3-phosphate synthase [Desulfobacteraceae bacterium]